MKVKCLHGFFLFEELIVGQLSDFRTLTGLALVADGPTFTFETLADAPRYSLAGSPYLGFTALSTFAGEPWEIFEANEIVYDFSQDLVVPLATVVERASIALAGNRYLSPGLILPGSFTPTGDRVVSYSAWFSRDTQRWLYSEVGYA